MLPPGDQGRSDSTFAHSTCQSARKKKAYFRIGLGEEIRAFGKHIYPYHPTHQKTEYRQRMGKFEPFIKMWIGLQISVEENTFSGKKSVGPENAEEK